MQNQIYCSICEDKLENACDKVVCQKCFTFICQKCLHCLTKKECPSCRTSYDQITPASTAVISFNSSETDLTQPNDILANLHLDTTNHSTGRLAVTNRLSSTRTSNQHRQFYYEYSLDLQRAIDNSLITYENETYRIDQDLNHCLTSRPVDKNTSPNNQPTPNLLPRNISTPFRLNRNYNTNAPVKPNWNHIMLDKETGVRNFFHERAAELYSTPQTPRKISTFEIVSKIRKEYELTPRWKDYIDWVKIKVPGITGSPPVLNVQ